MDRLVTNILATIDKNTSINIATNHYLDPDLFNNC